MKKYLNRSDASMRLDGTICLWKGEPVYVRFNCDGGKNGDRVNISYFDGSNRRQRVVTYTSKDFTFYPIRLGYMNRNGNVYYLARLPNRRQKQGLCSNNVEITPMSSLSSGWFPSTSLYNLIMDIYPTSEDVRVMLEKGQEGIALDRDIAFRKASKGFYKVFLKTQLMGTYETNEGRINLLNNSMTSIFQRILEARGFGVWLA